MTLEEAEEALSMLAFHLSVVLEDGSQVLVTFLLSGLGEQSISLESLGLTSKGSQKIFLSLGSVNRLAH